MANTDWLGGRKNLSLGPVNATMVAADANGNDVVLGGFENFTIRMSNEKADLVYSQYGTKAANRVIVGQDCTIEARLAQATLERMTQVMQGFRINPETGGTITGYSFGDAIGDDDLSNTNQLNVVRVIEGADSANTLDTVNFWLTVPNTEAELVFDAGSQHFIGAMFQVYKDSSNVDREGKSTFFGSGTI